MAARKKTSQTKETPPREDQPTRKSLGEALKEYLRVINNYRWRGSARKFEHEIDDLEAEIVAKNPKLQSMKRKLKILQEKDRKKQKALEEQHRKILMTFLVDGATPEVIKAVKKLARELDTIIPLLKQED